MIINKSRLQFPASLTFLGSVFFNMVYELHQPNNFMNYKITKPEMLNFIIVIKVWGHHQQDKHIEIKSDIVAFYRKEKPGTHVGNLG